jgi:Zn-dependent M28 family amino/carboxypeptidase
VIKSIILFIVFWMIAIPSAVLAWVKQPYVNGITLQNVPSVDEALLKKDVDYLSKNLAERNFNNVKTLNLATTYIHDAFALTSSQTSLQSFKVDGELFSNVIARFGPIHGDPVIIGAHYDAEEHTMGADDNASGVAGLIALARVFKEHPPSIPVELVAFTLEEPPNFRTDSMGSRHHAAGLVSANIKPKLVMVLEMIGYFSDQPNSQDYPISALKWLYPSQGNFIGVVSHFSASSETRLVKSAMAAASTLPVESINAPASLTGIDFSDHASYWLHNIPAVMITDTSFYRNPNYHQATDTTETLDFTRMAQVVQAVYGVVKYIETEKAN